MVRYNVEYRNAREFITAACGQEVSPGSLHYLLLDGARLPGLSNWLCKACEEGNWLSLTGVGIGTPLFEASPILVRVEATYSDSYLRRLFNDPECARACCLLLGYMPLEDTAEALSEHFYIHDPDDTRWTLAFWDPFILAALLGLQPANNELVPGPVLTPEQAGSLASSAAIWTFRDRRGKPVALRADAFEPANTEVPLHLDLAQITQLTDLPLPDLVLQGITQVMPAIVEKHSPTTLHALCCQAIKNGRAAGEEDLAAYSARAFDLLLASQESPRQQQGN